MAREVDFRKSRLGEYSASSNFFSGQDPLEISHCSRDRMLVSLGKSSTSFTNDVFSVIEFLWKLQLVGFSNGKKSANA